MKLKIFVLFACLFCLSGAVLTVFLDKSEVLFHVDFIFAVINWLNLFDSYKHFVGYGMKP